MSYETKSYQELRKLCVENSLNGNGTREDLLARLQGAVLNDTDADTQTPTNDKISQPSAPSASTEDAVAPSVEKKVEREWRADAKAMEKHLAGQPKVRMMIPLEMGERAENGATIPFLINLNGYEMKIKRGEFIDVPKQVATMIQERLESEGKIGREWRMDRSEEAQTALS
jgi:hypothetical protein